MGGFRVEGMVERMIIKNYLCLTHNCNLDCTHCYFHGNHIKDTLSRKSIQLILENNKKTELNHEYTLTGGEATLHPDFYEIVDDLHQEKLRLDSNGYALEHFFDLVTPNEIPEIRFSIDGVKNHDLIRGIGSFKQCISSIQKALRIGFFIEITMTVMQTNINDVPFVISLAKRLGVNVLNFHLATNILDELSPLKWLETVEILQRTTGIIIKYPLRYCDKIPDDYCNCTGLQKDRITYFPDGKIRSCAVCYDILNEEDYFKTSKECGYCSRIQNITQFKKEHFIPLCIYYKRIVN